MGAAIVLCGAGTFFLCTRQAAVEPAAAIGTPGDRPIADASRPSGDRVRPPNRRKTYRGGVEQPEHPDKTDDGVIEDWEIPEGFDPGPTSQGPLRCAPNAQDCGDECRNFSDCPSGHACLVDPKTRLYRCFKSGCAKDSDCASGMTCAVVSSEQQNDVVRVCLAHGSSREGEACINAFGGAHCAPGLVCHHSTCMQQCSDSNDCHNSTCADVREGRVCLPNCFASGCSAGFRCLVFNKGMSFCIKEIGENCLEKPICAQDEVCLATHDTNAKEMRFRCHRRCDSATGIGCKDGEVCGFAASGSACYTACKPEEPGSCEAGEQCATVNEEANVFGCVQY